MKKKNSTNFNFLIKKGGKFILPFFFIFVLNCSVDQIRYIHYSGNLNGYLNNCNCPKLDYGSILNHSQYFRDSLINRENTLNLSIGNIFSHNYNDVENFIINEIIEDLNYDIIIPGKNDIKFIEDMGSSTLISLNANIENVNKYKKFSYGSHNIIITGLNDPQDNNYLKDKIISELNIDEIKKVINSIRSDDDILIFISKIDTYTEKKIFNSIKGIDIMISGSNPDKENFDFDGRVYLSPGNNGRFIGKISFDIAESGSIKYRNSFTAITNEKFPENIIDIEKVDSISDSINFKKQENSIEIDL